LHVHSTTSFPTMDGQIERHSSSSTLSPTMDRSSALHIPLPSHTPSLSPFTYLSQSTVSTHPFLTGMTS
jgi:hypothetical protein